MRYLTVEEQIILLRMKAHIEEWRSDKWLLCEFFDIDEQ